MTRTYTERPVWTWKCDRCGFETGDLARQQYGLPSPEVMRERGWFIADLHGDLCPRCVVDAKKPAWRDRHGDVWTLGTDGLLHARETAPFTREHVEKKWGPLTPTTSDSETGCP